MDIQNKNTFNKFLLDDVARRIGCYTLYRYRPINPNEIDALVKGYLWFSSANDLNDPFEGCIKLKEVEQDTTMEISLNFSISRNGETPKVEEKIFEISNLIGQSNDYYKRVFQSMLAQTKICCFSKSKSNKLMWSHYADKHKGMVLEYDISFDLNLFGSVIPVIYHKKSPEINFMEQRDKSILTVLKNKSDEWSYEQEVRLINDNPAGAPNKVLINPQSLRSVIFGCKTSNEDKEKIKMALRNFYHVKYQQSRLSGDEYELFIEPASHNDEGKD